MTKVKLTETILRDGHQSLLATRMETDEMLPVLEEMDKLGYHSLEVWGGATFDSCIRYLDEDPWERLRKFKEKAKNTPLQMLLRGQNILGYKHYPDDVLEKFVEKSIKNGIDIIRIFDEVSIFDIHNKEVLSLDKVSLECLSRKETTQLFEISECSSGECSSARACVRFLKVLV